MWDVKYADNHIGTFVPIFEGGGASFPLYGGTYDNVTKIDNDYVLVTKENIKYEFNSAGKLEQITDRNNNVVTLVYDGTSLVQVKSSQDREIDISYGANGKIASVHTPSGATYTYEYDDNENLTAVKDPNGNTTLFTYDENHQLISLTDPKGNIILTNTYDNTGRVIQQADAYNKITLIQYDTPSQGDATINYPNNSKEVVHHDNFYRQTAITDALGYHKYYMYDANGNPISITNENNEQETREYDLLGNLLNQTLPGDRIYSYQYNSFNEPISKKDPNGNITTYHYSANGNLLSIFFPDQTWKNYTYNFNGTLDTYTDGDTSTTYYSYEDYSNLTTIKRENKIKSFTYDTDGRITSETDENNHTTILTYDANGNLINKEDAFHQNEKFVYDANNHLLTYTDKRGLSTEYGYDNKGRLISKTNPINGVVTYNYDDKDNLTSVKDENGNTISNAYDSKERRKTRTNALGTVQYNYDGIGNLINETDAKGKVTTYTYTNSSKVQTITNPLGNVISYGYDKNRNIISFTDAMRNTTQYSYDAVNRVIAIIDAASNTTTVAYNANGKIYEIIDPNKHKKSYTYDALDRQTDYLDPSGYSIHYEYDDVGNVTSIKKPTGTITKQYDKLNRVVSVSNSTGDNYSFNYDEDNNLLSMSNNVGTSSFVYDSLNRMIQYKNPFSKQVGFTYDAVGNKTAINYPGNLKVQYVYDEVNDLKSVTDWLGHTFIYSYDANSRVTSLQYPNSTSCNYGYDDAGQLIKKENVLPDSMILASSSFTLDANGNRISEQRTGPQPSDLIPASFTYNYDNDNKLLSDSINNYINDLAGNRTAKYNINTSSSVSYTFSVDNLLKGITDGITTSTFDYDPLGNRLSRTIDNVKSNYVLDISNALSKVLQATDTSGNVNMNYVYGNGLLESIDAGNNALYYHFDAQHNTVAITDQVDSIRTSYTYDPFGVVLSKSGNINQPFTFLGEYGVEQEDSSLYYIWARYYDAMNGRFLSKDAFPFDLNDPQTLNEYVYGLNNPLVRFDYNGLYGNFDGFSIQGTDGYLYPTATYLSTSTGKILKYIGTISEESESAKKYFLGFGAYYSTLGTVLDVIGTTATALDISNSIIKYQSGEISGLELTNEVFKSGFPEVAGAAGKALFGDFGGLTATLVAEGSVDFGNWLVNDTSIGNSLTDWLAKTFYP